MGPEAEGEGLPAPSQVLTVHSTCTPSISLILPQQRHHQPPQLSKPHSGPTSTQKFCWSPCRHLTLLLPQFIALCTSALNLINTFHHYSLNKHVLST